MSSTLLRIEAIEARLASYSCPRGTPGRVHTLRLRRRFQFTSWPRSVALRDSGVWDFGHNAPLKKISDFDQHQQQHPLPQERKGQPQPQPLPISAEFKAGFGGAIEEGALTSENIQGNHKSSVGILRRLPPRYRLKAYHGDTFGLPFINGRDALQSNDLDSDTLRQALQSENPHAILSALLRLMTTDRDGIKANEIFHSLSSNTFSEVLRCLDAEHFVGRYLNLHKSIGPLLPRYQTLQPPTRHGLHQFSVNFMARIRFIISLRRSKGFGLSLSDYKYLLRIAGSVENPRASRTLWLGMQRDGVEPDTECYNHYLSGLLQVGISISTGKRGIRIPPKIPYVGPEGSFQPFRGHYEKLGINIKYEATKIFGDMIECGVVGDETTFSLLMISLARVGDVHGVKGILSRVWDINVDMLMSSNERVLGEPKFFPLDSPYRPSRVLLSAIAHSFAINNQIAVAIRLMDYVSLKYSIIIPTEVWEDLFGLCYWLSTPPSTKPRADAMGITFLPRETVTSLWEIFTEEPYSVKPNMAMYDYLIVSLIRRQRLREAQVRMEEARNLHKRNVYKYEEMVAIEELQSSIFEETRGDPRKQGSIAYQNYLGLQRDKNFQHLFQNSGRQMIARWCRIFLDKARSSAEIPIFTAVLLPSFIYDFNLFVPPVIRYHIATGTISFRSGSLRQSRRLAMEKATRKWTGPSTELTQGALMPPEAFVEDDVDEEEDHKDEDLPGSSRLDSEDVFRKS